MLVRNAAGAKQEAGAPLLFLSHAGEESEAARALAVALRGAGVEVWLDVERLKPGDRWQHEIGAALRGSHALILYVGRAGVARWVDFEVQIALDRAAKDSDFRLIPVLGPGADPAALPDFVKLFHWLDLREDAHSAPEKLKELLTGVLNRPAERIAVLPPDRPPFRGLLHFDVEDAVVFFGRERETEELLRLLGKDSFLLVVGDSGCGKSSIVRAGLVPALLRGRFHDGRAWVSHWRIAITRPGNDPFAELAESLPDLASEVSDRPGRIHANRRLLAEGTEGLRDIIAGSVAPNSRTLLVVDQFEELFTLTPDATIRRRYIDSLLQAAKFEGSRPVQVVVTLRADFFGRCWESSDLLDRVRKNQYLTPRLSTGRLRELIERPLAMADAEAEPGLIETMLGDVGDEPGNLALLEHALDQLWQKRQGGGEELRITHEAYESLGRLSGALRTHANAAMKRLKGDKEKALARRFFVDLTQLGEGTQDTRRRVKIEELTATAGDLEKAIEVLEKLASERLITTGDNHAEVAHEELIRSWPELRSWIDADRHFMRRERRFLEDAKEWRRLGKDPEALLRGARLVEAEAWLASSSREVPALVRQLVEESATKRKREEDERESHRQAEVVRLRKSRALVAVAAAIFIILALTLAYFWWSARKANRMSLARSLAAQAQLLEIKNPELLESQARLAAESLRRQWTHESERSVRRSVELLARPVTQLEQGDAVISVSFSSNGLWAVSGSRDNTARVWDLATEREISRVAHESWVNSVAFSPDGKWIVSGSDDETASVWEAATGKEITRFQDESSIKAVAFSPAGNLVGSGSDNGTVRIWKASTGEEILRLDTQGVIHSVAFSADGKWLASAGDDEGVHVWDTTTGEEIAWLAQEISVYSIAFSPNGRWLASGDDDAIRLWEVPTGEEVASIEQEGTAFSVAFSPDGRWLVSGGVDNTVRVREAATGEEIARLEHEDSVTSVAISPDGTRFMSGSLDGTVRVWEAPPRVRLALDRDFSNQYTSVASPDMKRIATSNYKILIIWEAAKGRLVTHFEHGHGVNPSLAFSYDGQRIITGGWDGTARIWDVETGREIARVEHGSPVGPVALSPDGHWAASGTRGHLGRHFETRIWDVTTKKEIARFRHQRSIRSLSLSAEGKIFILEMIDKTVRAYDLASRSEVVRLEHQDLVLSVGFSPEGKQVASGSRDGGLRVWDIATKEEIVRWDHGSPVSFLTFSPDGMQLASGGSDEVRVWDIRTGKENARIELSGPINTVAFSLDSRWLYIASRNSVSRHALRPEDILEQICSRLWRNFTQEEWQRYLPGEPYRKTCPNLPAEK